MGLNELDNGVGVRRRVAESRTFSLTKQNPKYAYIRIGFSPFVKDLFELLNAEQDRRESTGEGAMFNATGFLASLIRDGLKLRSMVKDGVVAGKTVMPLMNCYYKDGVIGVNAEEAVRLNHIKFDDLVNMYRSAIRLKREVDSNPDLQTKVMTEMMKKADRGE